MKFPLALVFLMNFFLLSAETNSASFNLDIKFGFCSSAGSGQAIALVDNGTEPYTYQWSDPALSGTEVFDLEPGAYSLTVVDATGCEEIGAFEIPENSTVFVQFEIVKETCESTGDGGLLITNYLPGDLLFSLDGVNFSDETIYNNLSAGSHTLYFLESNGCITTQVFTMASLAPLIVDLGPNVEIRLGDSIQLDPIINSPFGPLIINWSTSSIPINCTNCQNPWFAPLETTVVTIEVTDENGCTATDEIIVEVDEDTPGVYIPNAFTPNRDGNNDLFRVYAGPHVEQIKKFTIANNVGGIVFSEEMFFPNGFQRGWDGTFRNALLDPGVFIYQVTVEYVDGRIEDIFGSVTMIY